MKFKTIKETINHLQHEGYDPTELQNSSRYVCQTWKEVEEQLEIGDVHTFIGEWFYFGIEEL